MDAFIQALPKAEFHLHLETSIPWHIIRPLHPEPLPETPVWWQDDFRYPDFADFEAAMRPLSHTIKNGGYYHAAAAVIFANLLAQNVRYVEISFGARWTGTPFADIVAALHATAPAGLIVKVIVGINRNRELLPVVKHNLLNTPGVDGIDLHGDERYGRAALFTDLFREARERDWIIRAHAGELLGAEHVRETLDALQVKHIMHGVRAIEDADLVKRIIDEGIWLHCCPTSNIKLQVYTSMQKHPIADWLRQGARITLNTDGQTMFGCSLTSEMQQVTAVHALTKQELAQLQINAFAGATMPEQAKQAILAEIAALL